MFWESRKDHKMKKGTIIIAEAGVNHNGDMNLARKLIDAAVEANVDYIKFQTFKADKVVIKKALRADYQVKNSKNKSDTQYQMLKRLELSEEDFIDLNNYCEIRGINFLSTAFDIEGLEFLNRLGVRLFKIPSGEITNYGYLKKVSSFKKPVILSTGMSEIHEIKAALDLLTEHIIIQDITILHCNSAYPTPYSDVNLYAMQDIKNEFGVDVGYSDHTLGIEIPFASVVLGASVIEKHFTLDRQLEGPDHLASLEPNELKEMVRGIRNIEEALSGTRKKEVSISEKENKVHVRRSLYFKRDVKNGEKVTQDMFVALRPGDGISPMQIPSLIGRIAKKDLMQYSKVMVTHFE